MGSLEASNAKEEGREKGKEGRLGRSAQVLLY